MFRLCICKYASNKIIAYAEDTRHDLLQTKKTYKLETNFKDNKPLCTKLIDRYAYARNRYTQKQLGFDSDCSHIHLIADLMTVSVVF